MNCNGECGMIAIECRPVAIVNIGSDGDEHVYEVRINRRVLFTFKHTREDGLAECLRRASVAAQKDAPSPYCVSCGCEAPQLVNGVCEHCINGLRP